MPGNHSSKTIALVFSQVVETWTLQRSIYGAAAGAEFNSSDLSHLHNPIKAAVVSSFPVAGIVTTLLMFLCHTIYRIQPWLGSTQKGPLTVRGGILKHIFGLSSDLRQAKVAQR